MDKRFRPCAGVVVFNREGLVFLGCRSDVSTDSWQLPQGGIENNELPYEAAQRELFEETGIKSVQLVKQDTSFYKYEFPAEIKEKFRKKSIYTDGQNICFSLFYFDGESDEICLTTKDYEFRKYKWDSLDFAVENVVSFKKEAYNSMSKSFSPMIKDFLNNLP